jgi:hypothetical protein
MAMNVKVTVYYDAVMSHKTTLPIFTTMRTSDLIRFKWILYFLNLYNVLSQHEIISLLSNQMYLY